MQEHQSLIQYLNLIPLDGSSVVRHPDDLKKYHKQEVEEQRNEITPEETPTFATEDSNADVEYELSFGTDVDVPLVVQPNERPKQDRQPNTCYFNNHFVSK